MTYHVKGFSCITCAVGLDTMLNRQKGIVRSNSTYPDGIVTIDFYPGLIAGDMYTIPAWSLNNVYARVSPRGIVSSLFIWGLLGIFGAAASVMHAFCKYEQASCEAAA